MTNTMPGARKPSLACEAYIKGKEKCRLKAFLPTKNDVPTIGWGRTAGVTMGMVQTQAQADADFAADLVSRGRAVDAALGQSPTTQHQFDAMVSLAYNIGIGGFLTSSVRTNHRAGHYATAALAFSLWDKQRDASGKLVVVRGLSIRRAEEAAMYRLAA